MGSVACMLCLCYTKMPHTSQSISQTNNNSAVAGCSGVHQKLKPLSQHYTCLLEISIDRTPGQPTNNRIT